MEIKEAVSHSQDWRVSGVQIVLEEGGGLIMIITESHLSVWGKVFLSNFLKMSLSVIGIVGEMYLSVIGTVCETSMSVKCT